VTDIDVGNKIQSGSKMGYNLEPFKRVFPHFSFDSERISVKLYVFGVPTPI